MVPTKASRGATPIHTRVVVAASIVSIRIESIAVIEGGAEMDEFVKAALFSLLATVLYYDAVGNRLSAAEQYMTTAYGYDDANRMTSANGVPQIFDPNGNLLNDGVNTYSYDPANRLSTVSGPQSTVSYGYKKQGDRLQQTTNGQTTSYVLDLNGYSRRMRAQSAVSGRYYRESSRFSGIDCRHHGKSLRADIVEAQISELVESLILPKNWQAALQEILRTKKDAIDPQKEKARIKNEIRRMREAYKRGLYENDEHNFWREVESLQMQLNALEQLTPHEFRKAGFVLENLQPAWLAATMDEKQELCQIIFQQVMYDFETGKVVKVVPKAEYDVLFGMIDKSI